MKTKYYCIIFIALLFFSCNNSRNKAGEEVSNETLETDSLAIDWQLVECQSLPYEINTNSIYWEDNLEKFYINRDVQYNQHPELNSLFSGSTEMDHKPWEYFGKPSTAIGHFFKRLPDVKNNKVLLFAVFDETIDIELGEKSVWLELQIFNKKNDLIDKKIVFISIENECDFYRNFTYYPNNVIEIRDRERCNDTDENATLLSDTTIKYFYQVIENGKIVDKK
ncbi:hypothetical protein AGMMS50239_33000 [Bacteroidia bacterium]|nr:hypothetical protein AGMMS50239_33000 [Bacteroidia bacterium]